MTRLRTSILVLALGVAVAGLLAKDAVTVGIGLRAPERADFDALHLRRDQVAVPARPVGRRPGLPLRRDRLRRRDQPLPPSQDRLLQLR